MTTHSTQRFPVTPGLAVAISSLFMAAEVWLLLWVFLPALASGNLDRLVQHIHPANKTSPLAQALVLGVGVTIVWLGALSGWQTVVVLSEDGISLERWGRRRWLVRWPDYAGWRWEEIGGNLDSSRESGRLALWILERNGTGRRVPVRWYLYRRRACERLLEALRARAPEDGEQPPLAREVRLGADPVALVSLLIFLTFCALVAYQLCSLGYGFGPAK